MELLLQHGWTYTAEIPCPKLTPGFYEWSLEEDTAEFYLSPNGDVFIAKPLEETPTAGTCQQISEPSFVEEIAHDLDS